MDRYYKNIRNLIEANLVEIKKQELNNNYHTLMTYYNIGKELVQAHGGQTRAKYGDNLIRQYSLKLSGEFGKNYNFSTLKRMRQFYLLFPKGVTLSHQLSWSHIVELLPINIESKRNYYINSIVEHGFSVRQLREYIRSNAYERLIKK